MTEINQKDIEAWIKMHDFVKWNYEGDYRNKLLTKLDKLIHYAFENELKFK